jgi:hypothetical protein
MRRGFIAGSDQEWRNTVRFDVLSSGLAERTCAKSFPAFAGWLDDPVIDYPFVEFGAVNPDPSCSSGNALA